MPLSLLYVTFPTEEEANEVAHVLLENHLIACANMLGPIKSLYRWEEKVEEGHEIAVLFKTTSQKVQNLIDTLTQLHSYGTPAIVEISVAKSAPLFTAWVQNECQN